jgi:hypothetical protein
MVVSRMSIAAAVAERFVFVLSYNFDDQYRDTGNFCA